MDKIMSSTNPLSKNNSVPSTGNGSFDDRYTDDAHISDSHQFHYRLKMVNSLHMKSGK